MNRASFLRLAVTAPWALRHAAAGGGTGRAPDPRRAAVAWLLQQQSDDGAWRSDTYGAFRDGRALTPVVLRALAAEKEAAEACRAACRWLLDRGAALFDEYPVHLASAVLECATRFAELSPLAATARERLAALHGAKSGGWSYSPVPPPATGNLAPMQQPNLAATVMALDGLHAAGLTSSDPMFREALRFVRACQNHATGDPAFDDGGFFQMPDDRARNKAGIAGEDRRGETRYRSYASATADGLRALLRCGESPGSPRVVAATSWLRHFRWSPGGAANAPADLSYYTARSMAKSGVRHPDIGPGLASLQHADGSWRNPAGEMREDCPMVATALALESLRQDAPVR